MTGGVRDRALPGVTNEALVHIKAAMEAPSSSGVRQREKGFD